MLSKLLVNLKPVMIMAFHNFLPLMHLWQCTKAQLNTDSKSVVYCQLMFYWWRVLHLKIGKII